MPKISELPLANKLKEEDYIPIVQDGVTKKVKGTHFVTEEEYSLDAFSPTIAANDKAMYKFGEGDTVDFSDSAYDGAYKSAILKGNTLVNILNGEVRGSINQRFFDYLIDIPFKDNQVYTAIFNVSTEATQLTCGLLKKTDEIGGIDWNGQPLPYVNGYNKVLLTPVSNSTYGLRIRYFDDIVAAFEPSNVMLIEGDYTNVDIPYFEGMQSVRMPVLTTTGKNLYDGELKAVNLTDAGVEQNSKQLATTTNFIKVSPKMTFSSHDLIGGDVVVVNRFNEYDENKNFIRRKVVSLTNPYTYTPTDGNVKYVSITFRTPTLKDISLDEFKEIRIQIERGSVATPYEPYKSNILSCLELVELGGVGDVQDTLNLLTGEVVESTYEHTFNGTESNITLHSDKTNKITFRLPLNVDVKPNIINGVICNKMKTITIDSLLADDNTIGVCTHNVEVTKNVYIAVLKSDLETQDINGFKKWLEINTPTVRAVTNEKVHKTVDLSGTPFGYKGGHIIKSSAEGSLLPKFEYEVAVSRGAQISQNTSTLIKHDEKITELLKKTAATYINQKAEIAYLLNMSSTLEEVQTIPFIEDDYVNDDCMVDSDMVMDDMEVEPEKEIIDNVDTLLINLIYDLIELNDTLGLSEKVELFRQSGLIDKHNYEIIKEKLNPTFKEEDYADINQ